MIIVFEGIDGSGKGTQSKKLSKYLSDKGINNALFTFPNYDGTFFGGEVAKYLNGSYGNMKDLPAQFPAMLYAMDRFEMKSEIINAINKGDVIIFDRYVPSNFAHQAAKLPENQQDDFINWVKHIEYSILGLPKPDIVFFLDITPEISKNLVLKKSARSYTKEKEDIHEKDTSYLEKVYKVYNRISLSDGWKRVSCLNESCLLSEDEIFQNIISFFSY